MTDAAYTDDLVLIANTIAKAEPLLHNQKQVTGGIGLYVNANKIEFKSFKQNGAISALSSKPLELVDQLTYLGSNILSTESDVNIHHVKTWNATDRISIIWKSNLSDEIKQDFFRAVSVSIIIYGTLTERIEKKLDKNFTRMLLIILNK